MPEKNQKIPKDKISCKICKYLGDSCISGHCEGCVNFSKFELDGAKLCKWCWNPAAPGDNICREHKKSHAEHSWPGVLYREKPRNTRLEDCVIKLAAALIQAKPTVLAEPDRYADLVTDFAKKLLAEIDGGD